MRTGRIRQPALSAEGMDFLFGLLNPYPHPPRNSPQAQNMKNQVYRLSVKEALGHRWFSTGCGSISLDNINDLRNGRPVRMMNVTPRPFPRYIQIHGEQLNTNPHNIAKRMSALPATSQNTPPLVSPPPKMSYTTLTTAPTMFVSGSTNNTTIPTPINMRLNNTQTQTTNNVISFATNNTSVKQQPHQPEPVMLNPFSKENIRNIRKEQQKHNNSSNEISDSQKNPIFITQQCSIIDTLIHIFSPTIPNGMDPAN